MKPEDLPLTVIISGVVVLKALLVIAVLVVLVTMAVLAVLVMTAVVLDVLVVTGSSGFIFLTTTAIKAPTATNTNDATPIIMNFLHFTVQPACAALSSSS